MKPEDWRPGAAVIHKSLGKGIVLCKVKSPKEGPDGFLVVVFERDLVSSWGLSKIGQPAHVFTDMWFSANPFTLVLGKVAP